MGNKENKDTLKSIIKMQLPTCLIVKQQFKEKRERKFYGRGRYGEKSRVKYTLLYLKYISHLQNSLESESATSKTPYYS